MPSNNEFVQLQVFSTKMAKKPCFERIFEYQDFSVSEMIRTLRVFYGRNCLVSFNFFSSDTRCNV